MKNKLHIFGLLSLALLTFSCSNDDYGAEDTKNTNLKVISIDTLKIDLNAIKIDSTGVNKSDGEPNNPKPPRR